MKKQDSTLKYYCDRKRHLICKPYSIENLHRMARELQIGTHFYEISKIGRLPHYDIPANRIDEIMAKCNVVTRFEIVKIIKAALNKN